MGHHRDLESISQRGKSWPPIPLQAQSLAKRQEILDIQAKEEAARIEVRLVADLKLPAD